MRWSLKHFYWQTFAGTCRDLMIFIRPTVRKHIHPIFWRRSFEELKEQALVTNQTILHVSSFRNFQQSDQERKVEPSVGIIQWTPQNRTVYKLYSMDLMRLSFPSNFLECWSCGNYQSYDFQAFDWAFKIILTWKRIFLEAHVSDLSPKNL